MGTCLKHWETPLGQGFDFPERMHSLWKRVFIRVIYALTDHQRLFVFANDYLFKGNPSTIKINPNEHNVNHSWVIMVNKLNL